MIAQVVRRWATVTQILAPALSVTWDLITLSLALNLSVTRDPSTTQYILRSRRLRLWQAEMPSMPGAEKKAATSGEGVVPIETVSGCAQHTLSRCHDLRLVR